MERTLILVKPDAFERGLTGEIIARFERKGLRIVAMKHMTVERDLAEQHYAEHRERPFFGDLRRLHHRRPARCLVLEGHEAVKAGPPGDRRDQPDRGRSRARSAGTYGARGADEPRCTAPTRPSPPRARSGCSSLSSA
jgi:hypothetical protein